VSGPADRLTEKLGPLPVWAWGGLLGGGFLIGSFVYKRAKGTSTPAAAVDAGGPSTSDAPAASPASVPASSSEMGSFMASGSYVPPGSGGGSSGDPANLPDAPTDNDEWMRKAITLTVAKYPQFSYYEVQSALGLYVDGGEWTEAQQSIVELAIKLAGLPPYRTPGNTIVRPTPVVVTPPPVVQPSTPVVPGPAQPPTPAPAPAPAPAPVVITGPAPVPTAPAVRVRPTLSMGSTGQAVKAVAQWLNVNTAPNPWLVAENTGVYDAAMRQQVTNLQQFMAAGHYTGQLGVVDAQMWDLLDYLAALKGSPIPAF